MDFRSTLLKINEIFNKFAIYDWIVLIIVLLAGLKLSWLQIHSDYIPYITSYIDFPHRTSTIPYENLCIIVFGLGGVITIILWIMYESALTPKLSKCLAAYYFSISLTIFFESALKQYVARPRPDTLENCQIDANSTVSYNKCAQVLSIYSASDQFLSFPSGHSAESMAACIFISLLLAKYLHSSAENSKDNPKSNTTASIQSLKANSADNSYIVQTETFDSLSTFSTTIFVFFQFIPIAFAIYVASSRIWDRVHHTDDVIMGLILGALISKITFNAFDSDIENDTDDYLPMTST